MRRGRSEPGLHLVLERGASLPLALAGPGWVYFLAAMAAQSRLVRLPALRRQSPGPRGSILSLIRDEIFTKVGGDVLWKFS